jgi:uncharacterized RDD family membrane protein YckC
MKANYVKRFSAYIIDIMLLSIFLLLFNFFIPESHNVNVLNQELNTINELALKSEISVNSYINQFADIIHDLDQERIMMSIVNAILIISYFVVVPYFKEGKTLGNYIVGIRIVREDKHYLSLNNLLIRNIIINGLGYMLISLACIYLLPSLSYFIVVSILGFMQILLVIISAFMVIYRKDKRGLHDILSYTKVIVDKKTEVKE